MKSRPILVLGCGNPSRGDDALAPEFLRRLDSERRKGLLPKIFDTITDFQLQIEHTLDLKGRKQVLFVDASYSAQAPFEFSELEAVEDSSHSTHALSPQALLAAYEHTWVLPAPSSWLLSIPGCDFTLGQPITHQAQSNLEAALEFARQLLKHESMDSWDLVLSQMDDD